MSARTYRALVIANSTFPNDSQNLIELEGPRNDPALLRDALCDRATGLFANDNVRLTLERTMAEVLREVEDFLRTRHARTPCCSTTAVTACSTRAASSTSAPATAASTASGRRP